MSSYTTGELCRGKGAVVNEMKITLPSLSRNEGIARAMVAVFCAQADPSTTELADIKCAVSEAVTNCIVHAYRDTIGTIGLKVQILEGRWIRIEIKDSGCGIEDVRRAREPLYTTDAAGERSGMGFTVMESFCDGVHVKAAQGRGCTVTLCKRLRDRNFRT
ncbi:MAG: anti-sigma F factor [Clostridia bacterium]|nr:anti-sigma F factor [Clostridia bacterium]